MAEPYELIIFDCDGVLIDSEVISTETLRDTLAAHGLDVDMAYVRGTYLGRSISVVEKDYRRLIGRDLPDTFDKEFLARLFAAYRGSLQPMAGVEKLLHDVTVPYCMATSSSIERARVSLEITGLLPLFDGRIFCASMVANGKPAPDLFLHAARSFGAPAERCLVIEDSEVGVLAAKNAGMTVWRFVGGSHFEHRACTGINQDSDVPEFASMDAMAAALREH
jgi:HAD superfamily hydrolase (TIGR01509 family)